MKYTSYSYPSGRAEVAAFVVTGGVTEYHVMIHATDPKQTYREQMNVVLDAIKNSRYVVCFFIIKFAIPKQILLNINENNADIISCF